MSETDESEPGSLILASELHPKEALISEDESLTVPFATLCGESVRYLGRTADGVAALSNFRFFVRYNNSFFNIALGLIDSIECRDIFYLYIYCKDARTVRCTFSTNESCQDWYKRLSAALTHPTKPTDIFAFAFHAWCLDACANPASIGADGECGANLCQPCDSPGYSFEKEIERLGFDLKSAWRVSYANKDFKVCGTYPKLHLVPEKIIDVELEMVANFRTSRRFPSVVWRDVRTGAVLVRASQPAVGWLGWRSTQDENLLKEISKACSSGAGIVPQVPTPTNKEEDTLPMTCCESSMKEMLIIDARSYPAAVANRAKGGGVECSEYYPNCEIQFMNLANIHTIRKSFHALRALCASPADQPNWLSLLENTKWLVHISGLMRAALIVVNMIDKEGRPVLVHCSDGWDRTPQITALSEILLDPYYRTIEGFRVLVEKEWLEFGHKFADRCGHGVCSPDTNERCPVFLQFLDCVHQTLQQFPCAFQFNEAFLVKLVQHTYSCLFGTFLGNHTQSRLIDKVPEQTCSVWNLLRPSNTKFRNYLYTPNAHQVLRPSFHPRHMLFWYAVYLSDATETALDGVGSADQPPDEADTTDNSPTGELDPTTAGDKALMMPAAAKTRSYDDLVVAAGGPTFDNSSLSASIQPAAPRRLSDPSVITAEVISGQPHKDLPDTTGMPLEVENTAGAQTKVENKKQIVIENDIVHFTSRALQSTDVNLSLFTSSDCNENPEEQGTEDTQGQPSFLFETDAAEADLSSPVPQTISDREILKHSTEEDTSSLGKRSSSETAIETSTDTLTGDLEQASSAAGDAKEASKVDSSATLSSRQRSPASGHDMTENEEEEDDDTTCDLTASLNGGLPLEMSATVSTSTTDISDSHILSASLPQSAAQQPRLPQLNSQSLNGQSVSLRLDNLLRLNIPETGRLFELGLSQSHVMPSGMNSIHSSNSSRDSDTYTPPTGQSRTPSSSSPSTPATDGKACWQWSGKGSSASMCSTLDHDGLVTWMSPGQARLVQMEADYQARFEQLQRQLHATRLALSQYVAAAGGCNGGLISVIPGQMADSQDNNSLADSQESGERASSLTSDMSWEQVEEKDAKMTLWVPDHAVTHCAGCDMEFWIVRRRHHCRNCGRVFCNECTNYSVPVPQQQLNTPVRVCHQCFVTIITENPDVASNMMVSNSGALRMNSSGGSSSGSSGSQFVGSGGMLNDGYVGASSSYNGGMGHFVFSNSHCMNNGNGNLATPTCNGVSGGQHPPERQVPPLTTS